ncbi:unnamed protein product [Fraxinus pennsylvanica]|uniref:Uncharacterized protein n=1 Tax=Fraxinus pennsylvanica TaxID=56036 RepID=A0AAD2A6F4_9LAMI|nr:unnamed protein product [Fraxinus pennsylvanica]
MIYLTDVWKLNITHASAIVNAFLGLIGILPFAMLFVADTFLGNFWMLLFSTLSFSTGMGMLTMSTPPVLANALDTCSAYDPECIGNGQRILFYAAIVLIAVGISGHAISLGTFIAEQFLDAIERADINGFSILTMFGGNIATFIITTVAVLGLPYIKPWSLRFGIPTICMVVAMVIFLSGSHRYTRNRPSGSPLTILFRVLVASASKFFEQRPVDVNQYYGVLEYSAVVDILPPIRCWRCFEKAAIILPDQSLEQQQQNRWKLCALTEVRNAQYIVYMIPMAMAFIFGGLLSSLSHTYFIEQAKNMNYKVGSLTIPITVLFWFYAQGRQYFPKLYFGFANCGPNARFYAPILGISVSMMLGVLCCITAASVESRRLDVVRKHGLLGKPDDTIPMSVFWLLPQYILLRAVDGILEFSTAAFLNNYFILPWSQFMLTFTSLGQGLGCLGSVLCVYIVGKLSERGGNPSWFQGTLNESRLDKYYWTLAWLIASNIVPFIVLRFWYGHMQKKEEDAPAETQWCCCC